MTIYSLLLARNLVLPQLQSAKSCVSIIFYKKAPNYSLANRIKAKRFHLLSSQPSSKVAMLLEKRSFTTSSSRFSQTEPTKKTSKFKQFYSQYGPIFLVVHLTTVVMWIYGFFLISKQ